MFGNIREQIPYPFNKGERKISARKLNAMVDSIAELQKLDPASKLHDNHVMAKCQESISKDSLGDVKLCYRDFGSSTYVEIGDAFEAFNIGLGDAENGQIVMLSFGGGSSTYPFFQCSSSGEMTSLRTLNLSISGSITGPAKVFPNSSPWYIYSDYVEFEAMDAADAKLMVMDHIWTMTGPTDVTWACKLELYDGSTLKKTYCPPQMGSYYQSETQCTHVRVPETNNWSCNKARLKLQGATGYGVGNDETCTAECQVHYFGLILMPLVSSSLARWNETWVG